MAPSSQELEPPAIPVRFNVVVKPKPTDLTEWNNSYVEPDILSLIHESDIYNPSEELAINQSQILNLFDLLVKLLVAAVIAVPVLLGLLYLSIVIVLLGLYFFGIWFLPVCSLTLLAGIVFALRLILIVFIKFINVHE